MKDFQRPPASASVLPKVDALAMPRRARRLTALLLSTALLWSAMPTAGAKAAPATAPASLDERVQQAKSDVIQLTSNLLALEEDLLFPARSQVALFVSMAADPASELKSIQIWLDKLSVVEHFYTPLELQALRRGGVQRLYLGSVDSGRHDIAAAVTIRDPNNPDLKGSAKLQFEKGVSASRIELRINGTPSRLQPGFDIKVWQ